MMKNRQKANKKLELSQAEHEDDRRVDHAHFGQHILDDAEPYSPLDSVHSRFDEEECFDHPPRLIVYADYSARSEFSLDFQYEEESEAEVRINHLLKAMDYQLESTDWGDLSSKQTYFEDEEADGDFFNRSFLLDRSNKKKSQEEELRNYCKIWGTRFCHIGVRGTSIVGEQSYDGFTSLEDISKNDMTVRDIALFGGVEEEIIEEEGDYSELIALDVTLPADESEKDVCAQRRKRYSAKGFPPIEPEECMKDNVLHLLFENIWSRMCEVMKPLCMTYVISTRTPRHLQLKTVTKKNPTMHVEPFRTHMKPSNSAMDQNIQFGLGDAVSIRPYRTSTPQSTTTKKKGRRRRKQKDSTKPNVSRRKQKQKTGIGSERDYNQTHYEKEAPSNSPALTKDNMFPPLYQKPIMQRTNTYDNSSSNPSFKFPSISGVQRAPKYLLARAQTAIPPDYFVPPMILRPTSTRSKQHHVVFRNAPKRDTLFQNYSASEQKVIKFDSSLSVHSAPLHLLNEEHSNQKLHK